jgi:histidinol-phosphate/aromatic aminotransferase/cobyric acid decarboxylase-like protein
VLEAAREAAAEMNRYPDMGSAALYAALAEAMGVPVEDLAAATGSVALIYQLVNAFCEPGAEVVYAWRSFEAYPIAVTAGGARSVQVPVTADGRHDLDAMAAAVTDRTKVVIVCTPNNPTGPAVTQAELFVRVEDLVARRADLVARLREVGWELPDAQGNFVWFPLGDRALDFAAACGEVGISVRPFAGDGVRVSIGETEAFDRVVEVAARFGPTSSGRA